MNCRRPLNGFLAVWGLFLCCAGAAGGAGVPEAWVEVMGWEDASWWAFDAEGKARNVMEDLGGEWPRGGGGWAEGEGHLERVVDATGAPGVSWVEGTNAAATVERGEAGDVFLPTGRDAEGELYLTDAGSEVRRLKRWRREGGGIETVDIGGADFELVAPILRTGADGLTEVLGGTSMTVAGYGNVYLDGGMRRMEAALQEGLPGAMVLWREAAPTGGRWIAECAFRDRPATTVEADPEAGTWRVLAEYGGRLRATRREAVRWRASDGAEATGVLTWAEGAEGALPLAVFPHGGPGTCAPVAFDPRAYMLADAGFAVFQPNYRGSTGAGKAFRVGGWGVEGLRRAMLDIREGVEAVRRDGRVELREGKAFLLGGSWGGYCVLAQAAFWPEEYAAGVSFFGAGDLPALVEEEREMHGEPAAREVAVQLGLDGSGEALEALRGLSPVRAAGRIEAPLRIWHNRGDRTVAFGQSERFAAAMRAAGKACEFRAGEGGHGFRDAREEAEVYGEICGWWESVLRTQESGVRREELGDRRGRGRAGRQAEGGTETALPNSDGGGAGGAGKGKGDLAVCRGGLPNTRTAEQTAAEPWGGDETTKRRNDEGRGTRARQGRARDLRRGWKAAPPKGQRAGRALERCLADVRLARDGSPHHRRTNQRRTRDLWRG